MASPIAVLVTPLVGTLLNILRDPVVDHIKLAWNMRKELEDLKRSVEVINSGVMNAEEKQWKSEEVKTWLANLSHVAYDAIDLFDEIIIFESLRKIERRSVSEAIDKLKFAIRICLFHHRMGRKLKKVRDRLDAIVKDKALILNFEAQQSESVPLTTSRVTEPKIFGRDDETMKVVDDLINVNGICFKSQLSVYGVSGMGGVGKTTLANLVYNHPSVIQHFKLRMWISVPEDFNMIWLLSAILEYTDADNQSKTQQLNILDEKVQGELRKKRFLLVLDNVCNKDRDLWNHLLTLLSCGQRGSTVMVTIRDVSVAESIKRICPVVIHKMKGLSEADSWSLFKLEAFGTQDSEEAEADNLSIARQMLLRCHGVPLAIKTLGSMIWDKRSVTGESILEDMNGWNDGNPNSIIPILRVSYFHLTSPLRACFAYCCIYPKGHLYRKDQMVHLWLANGFILPRDAEELYDIANEAFFELVHRSFFHEVVEEYGNTTFKVHDLMHDLALSVMSETYSITNTEKAFGIPSRVCHLYLRCPQNYPIADINIGSLRSLLLSSEFDIPAHTLSSYIAKEKHLRVLDMSEFRVRDSPSEFTNEKHKIVLGEGLSFPRRSPSLFPESIAELIHLRYLDMSYSPIESLPKAVGFLLNLQTVKLYCCFRLKKLPDSMEHLTNLLYLDVRDCDSLGSLPTGIGKLKKLIYLSRFIVDEIRGNGIRELGDLELRRELSIENLDKITDAKEAKLSNLGSKRHIHSLCLSWRKGLEKETDGEVMEMVLDGLRPTKYLKSFSVTGYGGSKFPDWMGQLHQTHTSLTKISLRNIDNCQSLPPLWKLPCLEVLVIHGMKMVKCFFNEDYHEHTELFPALKMLEINTMSNLETWTATDSSRIVFPSVCKLKIIRCPHLKVLPACPMLERLDVEQTAQMRLQQLSEYHSLIRLSLSNFREEDFPPGSVGNKIALKFLKFGNMPELTLLSLEWDGLPNLRELDLFRCPKLQILPEGIGKLLVLESLSMVCLDSLTTISLGVFQNLSSLEKLHISQCVRLESLTEEMSHLKALRSLRIESCDALVTLPNDLQNLSCLWNLELYNCSKLRDSDCGWLEGLSSLSRLSVSHCFKLASLLETVAKIRKLEELDLIDDPSLEIRCKKGSGPDWQKISHVRTIWINQNLIQSPEGN